NSDERKKKTFEILVDGKRLTEQTLEKGDPPRFFDVQYAIPGNAIKGKKTVTVRFQATRGNEIGSVYGIRTIHADSRK
ncbi:MAG: DUF6805 domain-containing protein, partial [Thermoguttaceae bacterium]